MNTTFKNEIHIYPEEALAKQCDKCNLANNRIVSHPSYPNLRGNRILLIHEKPTGDSLRGKQINGKFVPDPNPLAGQVQQVLNRVYQFLGVDESYFSTAVLLRCYRKGLIKDDIYEIQPKDYIDCRDAHLPNIIQLEQPPVLIALTYTVAKYILTPESILVEDKYKTINELLETEQISRYNIPTFVTNPPDLVRLGNCASNTIFRRLCSQFIAAINKAATINKDYEEISSQVTKNYLEYLMKSLNLTPDELKKRYAQELEGLKNK